MGRRFVDHQIAVNCCVLLSGFTTHYAAFGRHRLGRPAGAAAAAGWRGRVAGGPVGRRLLRVLASYYPAMLLTVAGKLAAATLHFTPSSGAGWTALSQSARLGAAAARLRGRYRWWPELALLQSWWPDVCVDTVLQPAWTMSTLLLPWLLYPYLIQPALLPPAGRPAVGRSAAAAGMVKAE